jgi:hypothetical protein
MALDAILRPFHATLAALAALGADPASNPASNPADPSATLGRLAGSLVAERG